MPFGRRKGPEQEPRERVEVTLSAEVADKISLQREVVTTQDVDERLRDQVVDAIDSGKLIDDAVDSYITAVMEDTGDWFND